VELVETIAFQAGMKWEEVFEGATLLGLFEWSKNPTRAMTATDMENLCRWTADRLGESILEAADQVGWSHYVEFGDHSP
jgi:hypothetical protein